jgi:transcriptional regulator with XRE-family HTH domain
MAKRVTPADAEIGKRIRARRESLGLSLQAVADAMGVTYQQVQKYERGDNRVAGGRLQALAAALRTSVAEIIEDVANDGSAPTMSVEARRLAYAFDQLPADVREPLLTLAEGLIAVQATGRKRRAA